MGKIYVFGSINYDLVITSPRMPKEGETLTGSGFFTNSGGKGANQAVACAKLGGGAVMLGAVGDDGFGEECKRTLSGFGVDTVFVQRVENCNTGVAVIVIVGGDNRIILESGANARFDKQAMYDLIRRNVKCSDILLCQLEVPLECVGEAFKIAKENGALTVLNPAPARKLSAEILRHTDIIIPNESETELLTGIATDTAEGIRRAHDALKDFGVKEVLITLGSKGCYYGGRVYPAEKVENVVDTTAAGDTFIGALAAQISAGKSIEDSIDLCQKACALKITRKGAQIGIPTLAEVLNLYKK
jgi:ribokinase